MSLLLTDNDSAGSSDGMMQVFMVKEGGMEKLAIVAKLSQYLLDRFSRPFYQMEGICVNFLDPVQLFRFLKAQGTLPWQPILCRTRLVRSEPKYLRICWTDFHNLCTIW